MSVRRTLPSGSATTVPCALEHHDPLPAHGRLARGRDARLVVLRHRRRRRAQSRANSPGCGVSTAPCGTARHQPSCSASAFRPSASTTTGNRNAARKPRTRRSVAGWRPSPGPTTRASWRPRLGGEAPPAARGDAGPGASSSRCSIVSSGMLPQQRAATDSEVARLTTPAPARAAPRPASRAAPAYSREPATTSTLPKVPLCERAGRGGRRSATQRWLMPAAAIGSRRGAGARPPPRRRDDAHARWRRSPRRGPSPPLGGPRGGGGGPVARRRGSAGSRSRAIRRRARPDRAPC